MKAAIYREPGAPEVLHYEDIPDPEPGEGELLVRVEAISVEGGDLLSRQHRLPEHQPPRPVGYAAAGEVISTGKGVHGFQPGQKVATFAFDGSHAELRVAPAATCWAIPDGLDPEVAATIPCGPGTAALALELGKLQSGQTVLVTGAAGGVGLATVQLAHRAGARVLGTGSNLAVMERVREFGLADIVTVGARPISDQVRDLLPDGADLLIDCVGGTALTEGLAALKPGGSAILVGVIGGMGTRLDPLDLILRRLTVVGCLLGPLMGEPKEHAMIADLLEMAARGALTVPIDASFPLSEAAAAHAHAETRGRLGRVIIRP